MFKKKLWQRYMLRPAIYLTAFRTMAAVIVLLAIERFVPKGPQPGMIAAFLAVVFALLAYLVYLRMDGLRIPRMKYVRPKKKTDPMRYVSSMNDHMDEAPQITFEELEAEERDLCSLMANLVNLAIFLILSFII